MQKLNFLFGVCFHQPVGNFEHIFKEAYEKEYLPFLETLARHPKIKFSAHYSGIMYDWIKENHPDFFDLLKKLVKRGQVEMLSGGYYDPVMAVLPDEDKLGQIELANRFIKEHFLRAPRGMWLTGQVWEPALPKVLAKAGIEYLLVDEDHLARAGLDTENLSGYYITEEEGEIVKVFPINRRLREMTPFLPPEEIISHLQQLHHPDKTTAATFVCDGGAFNHRQEYLEKLLSLLEANQEWLCFSSFSDYLDEHPPAGRAYLPSASCAEMQEHAGGAGHFRNFLVRYPEANLMHKKMLHVSGLFRRLDTARNLIGGQQKSKELISARKNLYKGQCGSAYWHGAGGGLFLNYLRHAVYSHLIKAEVQLEKINRGEQNYADLTVTDFDRDGHDEVLLSNNLLNLYFAPGRGGSLFELDYKPRAFNLVNSLAQEGTDRHARVCLLDHFLQPDADPEKFSAEGSGEAGDFTDGEYSFMPSRREAEVGLRMSKKGTAQGIPLKIEKNIALFSKQSIFTVDYELTNLGAESKDLWFGIEFNFSMLAGNAPDRYYSIKGRELEDNSLGSTGQTTPVGLVKIVDDWSGFEVLLEMSVPAALWRFPVTNDFGYQSSVLLPNWQLHLDPGKPWKVKIALRIEE